MPLSPEERRILLRLARESVEHAVHGRPLPRLDVHALPPALQQPGVVFVTLTKGGALRGCIGALEAYQPLAADVREHAAAAATQDYRFSPVRPQELPQIRIEISRLTPPVPLPYDDPQALPALLRPHVDGVVLRDGFRRATFLPQVWEKIPLPQDFLSQLCLKMGAPPDLWRRKVLDVSTYQVEEFSE